jgi:hypothetical protein
MKFASRHFNSIEMNESFAPGLIEKQRKGKSVRQVRFFLAARLAAAPIVVNRAVSQICRMNAEPALELEPSKKLRWLRRLDGTRQWRSLDDRRCCCGCGKSFTGRQVEFVGGHASMDRCDSFARLGIVHRGLANWLYLHETAGRRWQLCKLPISSLVRQSD